MDLAVVRGESFAAARLGGRLARAVGPLGRHPDRGLVVDEARQLLPAMLGLDEGHDEPQTEDGEAYAGDDLDDDAVDPEVDELEALVVGQGYEVEGHVLQVMVDVFGRWGVAVFVEELLVVLDGVAQVKGEADEGADDVGPDDGLYAAPEVAPLAVLLGVGDGDVAPDGEHQVVRDGHRVADLVEVHLHG